MFPFRTEHLTGNLLKQRARSSKFGLGFLLLLVALVELVNELALLVGDLLASDVLLLDAEHHLLKLVGRNAFLTGHLVNGVGIGLVFYGIDDEVTAQHGIVAPASVVEGFIQATSCLKLTLTIEFPDLDDVAFQVKAFDDDALGDGAALVHDEINGGFRNGRLLNDLARHDADNLRPRRPRDVFVEDDFPQFGESVGGISLFLGRG